MLRILSSRTLVLCIAVLVLSSCSNGGGLKLGVDIPNQKAVKLSEISGNPAYYNGKSVVVKGIVHGQCPSLCEFFLKDGVETATIFPQGFKFPKLETGKPVTVYAQVTSGPGQVVFSALGVRMEKDGGK